MTIVVPFSQKIKNSLLFIFSPSTEKALVDFFFFFFPYNNSGWVLCWGDNLNPSFLGKKKELDNIIKL